ncbi:MAG: twin-arginine translocase TatA/TatE family subunit [Bacteroidales bacterium]|nr:twin-arginine translocase TatA/TatE family subunit [Bacteroidales bacterium]
MIIQPLFIGTTELLLIGGIALLLFGGKKLPEMMRGLGQGVREFKKGANEDKEEDKEEDTHEDVSENTSPHQKDSSTSDVKTIHGKEK